MVTIRPHHLLCIAFYKGHGYSSGFTRRMDWLVDYLSRPDIIIEISEEPDILCEACPNIQGGGCASGEKPSRYDLLTLEFAGISAGSYRYSELADIIRDRILSKGLLPRICNDCEWAYICHSDTTAKGSDGNAV